MPNFERLVIGSSHEGAEGMFESQESENSISPEKIEEARKERGIFPDADERYEQTLAERGLEQVRELENGMQYPTLDEWVDHRITYSRGTKFFPSFVKNQEGKTLFCKTQLSDYPDALQGLEREAERLQNIPEGVRAPRLVEYIPPADNRSAMLITEAISIREEMTGGPDKWSPEHAQDAVRQIKIMENQEIRTEEDPKFGEHVRARLGKAGETLSPDLLEKIDAIVTAYEPYAAPRFVHGDACTKNILLGATEGVRFVDWESEGSGFYGQDAAKLYSELRRNPEVGQAFLESYLRNNDGSIDEGRKNALAFGVAAESLVHLAWRNENIIAKGKQAEFPQLEQEIRGLNQRIIDTMEDIENISNSA